MGNIEGKVLVLVYPAAIILMVNQLQGKVVPLDVPRASIHEAVRCLTDKFCEALEARDWMWSRDRSIHNFQVASRAREQL